MEVLWCTPAYQQTRGINLPFLPLHGKRRSPSRVSSTHLRACPATLKSPNFSVSRRESDKFLPIVASSFLRTTPLTSPTGTNPNPTKCNASKSSFVYPKLTTKPKWWWRTLASIPYLYPLHNVWQYADAIYHLHHVLEKYEFLTFRFLDTMALLPSWVVITLFMGTYFLVVRRKEWPHFLRFHVALALLMDTGIQVFGTVCNWLPRLMFKNVMVYFWMTVAFVQAYTILECMRSALCGMYANVPFVSDTAFIHSDPKMMS